MVHVERIVKSWVVVALLAFTATVRAGTCIDGINAYVAHVKGLQDLQVMRTENGEEGLRAFDSRMVEWRTTLVSYIWKFLNRKDPSEVFNRDPRLEGRLNVGLIPNDPQAAMAAQIRALAFESEVSSFALDRPGNTVSPQERRIMWLYTQQVLRLLNYDFRDREDSTITMQDLTNAIHKINGDLHDFGTYWSALNSTFKAQQELDTGELGTATRFDKQMWYVFNQFFRQRGNLDEAAADALFKRIVAQYFAVVRNVDPSELPHMREEIFRIYKSMRKATKEELAELYRILPIKGVAPGGTPTALTQWVADVGNAMAVGQEVQVAGRNPILENAILSHWSQKFYDGLSSTGQRVEDVEKFANTYGNYMPAGMVVIKFVNRNGMTVSIINGEGVIGQTAVDRYGEVNVVPNEIAFAVDAAQSGDTIRITSIRKKGSLTLPRTDSTPERNVIGEITVPYFELTVEVNPD